MVASYTKYLLDIEALKILQAEFTPLEVTPESLAFDAHAEVGHAGHFLGATHTLERFRTCFYRPMVFSTANYQRWLRDGGADAAERAAELARKTIEAYERPPLDDGRLAELDEYVTRRRAELGD